MSTGGRAAYDEPEIWSVSDLQSHVRDLLETDYGSVWVEGELSGSRVPPSGHLYCTLKDERAELAAVMWRSDRERMWFEPEDGSRVRAYGSLTLYEPRGRYQMIVRRLEPLGAGALQQAFERMRRRLEAEGLFDPTRKRALPRFPRRVGLVTSPSGAAVQDMIHVFRRRWPGIGLLVVPTRVQGEGAAPSIAGALRAADDAGLDVLILARGGGSPEDLWAFNEEVVARALAACRTPVVCGVGHETDVTIADWVADVRAPTPSAAAELVAPPRERVGAAVGELHRTLQRAVARRFETWRLRLRAVEAAPLFRRPLDRIRREEEHLEYTARRLRDLVRRAFGDRRNRLQTLAAQLEALSPLRVLSRGYSLTSKEGRILTDAAEASPGDVLVTRLRSGEVRSRVQEDEAP